jgi:hypothetical protein
MQCYSLTLCAALVLLVAGCGDDAPPAPQSEVKIQVAPSPAPAAVAQPAALVPKADPDAELAAAVNKALESASAQLAQGVDVTAKSGAIRLFGTVGSETERREAANIARATPGVASVENNIIVVKGS